MTIANTGGTLTQMPTPIGPVDRTAHAAVGPDADSIDPAAPGDGMPTDAQFARVLTQRMAKGDVKDDASGPSSKAPDAASKSTDGAKVEVPPKDPKVDRSGDAIGNDLAAQLALASQWAGGAPPPSARDASASATEPAASTSSDQTALPPIAIPRASAESGDIDGKPATARGTKTPGDPTLRAAATSDVRAQDVATRTVARGGVAITDRSNDPKSKDEPFPQASGAEARSMEIANGLTQSPTAQPSADTSSFHAIANLATAHGVATPLSAPVPTAPDALRQVVGTPAWSHEVGNAMVRMAVDDLQSASLRLHPEHLGPLDVQVRVDNGIAHLAFQAAHADTRQALEASRPMLEHLFSERGLKIGDCAVGDSGSRGAGFNADGSQANSSPRDPGAGRFISRAVDGEVNHAVAARAVRMLGMVDTFA